MKWKISKYFFFIFFIFSIHKLAFAQNDKDISLAQQYFRQSDFVKAKVLFQKLSKDPYSSRIIHDEYLVTLVETKDFNEAEKFLKKQIKLFPQAPTYKADFALLLEKENKKDESDKMFNKLINESKSDEGKVESLGHYLLEKYKGDWAIKLYTEARNFSKSKTQYALHLAQAYSYEAKYDLMIEEYLNLALEGKNNNIEDVKNALQENLQKDEDFERLEKILIGRIQKNPSEVVYSELLMWHYLQQKDFTRAFIQARSIDKRFKLEGHKLIEIGAVAMNNKDYKSAVMIYEYVVITYSQSPIYILARRNMIQAKEELIKNAFPIDIIQINSLITDYKQFVEQVGKNNKSMEALRNMAVLYAFYLDKKDSALNLLQDAVKIGFNDSQFVGKCKLDIGDIYLLKGEPWESTLLYSQVEKSVPDQTLGYEAKLKNAKLSFYKGDFELAKSHLDVLKLATSREIANDAMALSLLISDNLIADTTGKALKDYANTELLLFQNKNQMALDNLEMMIKKYADNSLMDEILWLRANTYIKLNENQKAVNDLEIIVNKYNFDIYGDDAFFLMAKLYEEKLNQKDKAMELYREYLEKFPGTIYIPEARKRYRLLRGDKIN